MKIIYWYLIINLICITGLLSRQVYGQNIIGTVVDSNQNPIPYVNIGIVGGNLGTVSTILGTYSLDLSKIKPTDTLRFSSIGYYSMDFLIQDILDESNLNVILQEDIYEINEVVIQSNNSKSIELGNKNEHNSGWVFGGIGQGWELARLFTNKKNILLQEFQFHIYSSEYDSIMFRINVYTNYNGIPGQIINSSPIFVKSSVKKGWVRCNLIDYKLNMNNDFFVSVGAVEGWSDSDQTEIRVSGKDNKNKTLVRFNSLGDWKESKVLMDFYLRVKKQ